MSKTKEIHKHIKERLRQDISKSQIEQELASKYIGTDYKSMLKGYAEPKLMRKYKTLNNILIGCVVILALAKLLMMYALALPWGISPMFFIIFILAASILPVFLIILLRSYQATGYFITAALILSSLLQSSEEIYDVLSTGSLFEVNWLIGQMVLSFLAIGLSIFLYKRIHPNFKVF